MTKEPLSDIYRPTLVIARGIPGGGKSYLATTLQQLLGDDTVTIIDPDTIPLNSDAYRQFSTSLTHDGIDTKFHPYRYLRARAYDAITSHRIIIWNQAFTDFDGLKVTVERLRAFASEQQIHLPVLIVEVEINKDIAKQRVTARRKSGGHNVPADVFDRFIANYHSFAGNEYPTISVDGQNDINVSARTVLEQLRTI
ncbi:hypothetical protein A2707_02650 [Candidatus Saccharibacteria bacterium RIFCSPHIGHO2_01_FULL_45_15]|nr:MAG: hypothetical protein A2707_02650 [Candidatus Saccharibacteria bacterium RIFCSPHIGHO2_01_FULL_45_15]OGL27829.1 MAG: hypothetical protein A3C39_04995 [Candidatus Saccharibacteria bacterium RIFCSPHIGHO2_02_FULL_46_12]OGL31829.1 MAG: hypothetical protein A3E76_03245 [Candidatus Saccharibacteria bacterium RIFCSPHIGHO2_12_FULL_44_22]